MRDCVKGIDSSNDLPSYIPHYQNETTRKYSIQVMLRSVLKEQKRIVLVFIPYSVFYF
jgi:hypothetical protein